MATHFTAQLLSNNVTYYVLNHHVPRDVIHNGAALTTRCHIHYTLLNMLTTTAAAAAAAGEHWSSSTPFSPRNHASASCRSPCRCR